MIPMISTKSIVYPLVVSIGLVLSSKNICSERTDVTVEQMYASCQL